jgi:exosortase
LAARSVLATIHLSLTSLGYSYIVAIPFISLFAIYSDRFRVFETVASCPSISILLIPVALVTVFLDKHQSPGLTTRAAVNLTLMCAIVLVIIAFTFVFGIQASRAARFPLLLLFLCIPAPEYFFRYFTAFLQSVSTEMGVTVLKSLHIPIIRKDFTLFFPALTVEIEEGCSSVRSSTGMLLMALVCAHLFLRSMWAKAALVLASIPIALIGNTIRLCTLIILGLFLTPHVLGTAAHINAGKLFFIVDLALFFLALFYLRALEGDTCRKCTAPSRLFAVQQHFPASCTRDTGVQREQKEQANNPATS